MRLVGSLVVHAVLGLALFAVASHTQVPPRGSPPVTIDVVDLPAPSTKTVSGKWGRTPFSDKAVASRETTRRRRPAFEDPRGAVTFVDAVDASGTTGDGSSGAGTGAGRGVGIGFGDGGGVVAGTPPPPPPPPPAPTLSKARGARLIFPSRQRDVDDGELYIMRVIIDSDGYVGGATLVRGFGGRRDDVAAAQIWRFRYDPARDDDGEPIRSVLDQRFLVQ